jgi:pimeloyl-ACP methyl ester carboxylesterase
MAGMVDLNRQQYGAALRGLGPLAQVIYPQVVAMRTDPEHLVRRLEQEGSSADQEALNNPEYRDTVVRSIREAISRTLDGWAADSLAFTRPWGFDPAWITVPTLIWHSSWDVFAPAAHARWLAMRIAGATLSLSDEASHLSAAQVQVHVLRWLVEGDESWLIPHRRSA